MTFAEPATATWDVRGLLNSVKATTTVISSLKTAAAVKNWLLKDRRDPLRRALDGTIAKYEGTFPNIGPQLASLLSNPQFEAELQRLTEVGASNFSEIAASLAKAADFYDPDGGGFGEVLQTLIEAFDEELLLGSEGPVHHDRKQTALVQHVSAQVAGVSEHMAVMQALLGSERLRQVVARTKRRAEGRSYSEARAMWVLAEEEVAASGDTESAFQVHSEIGTLECGITHCSCLPARIICSRAARRGRVGKSRIVPSADLASAGIDGGANASWVVKNITVTNRAGLRAGIGESTSGGWAAGKRFAGTSHAPAHQTRSNLKENRMKLSNSKRSGNRLLIACAAVLAAAVAVPKAAHANVITVPPVPAAVKVDAPNEVFLVGHAQGTQNYVCLPSGSGVAFVLFTPEATLFNDDGDKALITHFFSPNPDEKNTNPALAAIGPIRATWQGSKDSSTVWAAASGSSTDAPFVAPNSVPWVRLTAVGWGFGPDGGDLLSHVTFVQRLNTLGGVAPSTGCATTADIGHLAFMPYTADYFFYTAPNAP